MLHLIIVGSCSEVVSSLWPSCFAATLNSSFAKDQEPDANMWSLVLPDQNTKTSCQKLYFAKWVLKNSRPTPRQYRRKEFTVFLCEYLKGWVCETMTWLTLTWTWLCWRSIKVFDLTVFGTKHGVCRGRHSLLEYAIGSMFFSFQIFDLCLRDVFDLEVRINIVCEWCLLLGMYLIYSTCGSCILIL